MDASGTGGTGALAGAGGGGAGGAGGTAAAGTSGGGGADGGATCLPPSDPSFDCAPTYDQQIAKGCRIATGAVFRGPCGPNWGWQCRHGYNETCVYDAQKNLVAAGGCGDSIVAPNVCPACGICGTDCRFSAQLTSPPIDVLACANQLLFPDASTGN